jgi:Mg2+-importing ATPase
MRHVQAPKRPGLGAYWAKSGADLLANLGSSAMGLSAAEAKQRLVAYGENRLVAKEGTGWLRLLLRQYESPLVLILIFAAIVSLGVQQWTEAITILMIIAGSTLLGFAQEYRASTAVKSLRERLALKVTAVRDGASQSTEARLLVPGDIVILSAGNLVPADGVVIEARDFLVSQATLTGESFPVEKRPDPTPQEASLSERANVVFLGTSVRSGTATMLVVETGSTTALGAIARRLNDADPETDFERGVRRFGYLLTRVMMVIVTFVFTANLFMGRPILDSLLFSVALAVGLTPELLPAIISVTLSAGAQRMAAKGVIVRRMTAIENLGSVDVLCTDKTGTLTQGVVELSQAADPSGVSSDTVFSLALANAYLETGIENPLDAAIVAYAEARGVAMPDSVKIDEIPYDFERKRLTIVVDQANNDQHIIITKGAFDTVLSCCTTVAQGAGQVGLDDAVRDRLTAFYRAKGDQGFRVLGLATRQVDAKIRYDRQDETAMVFQGFLTFFDPLKEGIETTLRDLAALGIAVKIITGDNRHVARHVGEAVGLGASLLTGSDLARTRDEALWHLAETTDIFAEVDPQQKERIVRALQARGHSVAYMGDGINDAPALRMADVGVSVAEAVDAARESADIVLLNRDLDVLRQGVVDGRRTFENTLKYVAITTSANFGNMISMAIGTLFLPYLPLLASQILLNNFLSDLPSIAISTDLVDPETVKTAPRWEIGKIRSYMIVFGLVSTVFDLITFAALVYLFHASESVFQSTWFVVSLLTELAVVLVLRTRRPSWRSRPGKVLVLSTFVVAGLGISLPYLGAISGWFGLVPLPIHLLVTGLGVVGAYIVANEVCKRWFYGRASLTSIRT